MATIKVMGHTPPDTDSTISPIVYAWYLREHKGLDAKAYIGAAPNKEAQFVLDYFNQSTPEMISELTEEDTIVLLDTNNPKELLPGYEQAEIIEIVDHHKLFGLEIASPPTVTMRPYGSVPTVIWEIMTDEAKQNLPKEIAGLMLAPIISDTLNLTSTTTTDADRSAVEELAAIAEIDVNQFAADMFAAKSDISDFTDEQVLLSDAKDFEFGDRKFKIGVLETTSPQNALDRKDDLLVAMTKLVEKEALDGMFFFVVDIINLKATAFARTELEKQALEQAFEVKMDADTIELVGVVSRKKQIVPQLEKAIS